MARFQDITIRRKLYFLAAFSTLSLALMMLGMGWLFFEYRINGPVYHRLSELRTALSEASPAIVALPRYYHTALRLSTSRDQAAIEALLTQLEEIEASYRERLEYWSEHLPDGPFKRAILVDAFRPAEDIFRIVNTQLSNAVRLENAAGVVAPLMTRIQAAYDKHQAAIDRAVIEGEKLIRAQEAATLNTVQFWGRMLVTVGLVAIVVLGATSLLLARGVVVATDKLLRRVNELSSGASDLTARVEINTKDEIGQLAAGINALIGKIQSVVKQVRESSIQLLSTASEIAATARQQEANVQDFNSSTSDIAAAVREISATGHELAQAMGEVSERASHASTLASSGRSRLSEMQSAMQQLVDSTRSISSKLSTIREKADNINVVVSTITKVADQTNLLSINAAIEAEKAGEYGRGFLVVAREIRRLADQTAVATLDIENIVRHMHDAVSAGVMQMDKFSEEVRVSVGHVAEINAQTGDIIEEVRGLGERFQLVNEGMRNQALGAQQINTAMVKMTGGAQQTAAAVEEFNRATSHLRNSVELLNQEISQFRI